MSAVRILNSFDDASTVELSYHDFGDPAGPPVLLLHSVGLDQSFWRPVAERLSGEWRVVTADIRGHGDSPAPDGEWTLGDMADDLAALLERLGIESTHVIGQSFGGLVAQHLVLRHGAMVRSLVLSGTSCSTSPESRQVFLERARLAEAEGMTPVANAAVDRWFTEAAKSSSFAEQARRRLLANEPRSWARTFRAIAQHHVVDELAGVQVPTLVITGDQDVATPPHFAHELGRCLPRSRVVITEGVPHMGYLETPEKLLAEIEPFLAEHEGRR